VKALENVILDAAAPGGGFKSQPGQPSQAVNGESISAAWLALKIRARRILAARLV